ncbi:MAG TPA: ABC transporter permease [Anaerolineae bacterium]|jgi:peptide/nickel transport system permease protein|nr:ABC transporter permease [Anaerolineae bacterium]
MRTYVIRRILQMIPVFLLVTIIAFVLMNILPGDPVVTMLGPRAATQKTLVERVRHEYGLDAPLPVQYVRFVGGVLRGDFGKSFFYRVPVTELILERFPLTITIAVLAMVVDLAIGMIAGTLSAIKQYSMWDYGGMLFALVGVSMPVFWLALLLQLVFAYRLGWFPVSGMSDGLKSLALPAITLGLVGSASTARMTRSCLLETLRDDYVRTARAKGLSERLVIARHVMRNALIPLITMEAIGFGAYLTGVAFLEIVFGLPGLGKLLLDAAFNRDVFLIQGAILFSAFIFLAVNLAVDILYGFLDPRIRYK